MSRAILHLDMDAFFAAVEQLDHSEYRGKPVIVGADPKDGRGRGVVATASYEARKYGIHSAMPISQAYKRCPHGIYLRGRYKRYSEISQQVIKILQDFTPVIEKISIDEAFLDVTGCMKLFGSPEEIAKNIKQRIRQELHLTASIGIAPNKFLAKIASDLQKPDGLVIVNPGEEKSFLKDLPISKLWGVGKKTEMGLRKMGISTIGQIAEVPEQDLNKRFGKLGNALWRLANGIDERPVVTHAPQKSISQETTFEEDTDDEELIERTLFRLADDLSRLMRNHHLKGRTLTLKIRLEDFSTYTRSRTLSDFVDSPQVIKTVAIDLYRNFDKKTLRVRLLGIGLSQLNSVAGEQLGLFDQEAPLDDRLTKLLDSLKDKFGESVVTRATLLSR
ncbi:DNA polymerase IV [candidate division KSB1 bacterium]|nr:DNA polymerase IV [candidate division KSB1 bacterium]NIR71319.1 DNA polymerase IV [candidate division KSB1 bacterium]NIS24829.1 DNA polymerase IV [candidate division KSB1 bacterium]NIT71749.1 DNA polymerase IV [candidate division KSB1 bacterium]NIU25464.1 DNA polymerase IV [candidate division KSB1 bacterium]